MAKKFTGRAYINVPGFGRLPTEKGSTLELNGVTKEAVPTDSGIAGFRDGDPVPGKIELSVHHHKDISIQQLQDFTGNIDFETDTGVSFKAVDCVCENPLSLSGGMIPAVFLAVRVEEQ